MEIKQKENENKYKLGNMDVGQIIGFLDGKDRDYYIVDNFDIDAFPFSAMKEKIKEEDFNYTMVTNLSTGYTTFVSSDARCVIIDLRYEEL